jgi:hypothetical protein
MGFNSAFKGLNIRENVEVKIFLSKTSSEKNV